MTSDLYDLENKKVQFKGYWVSPDTLSTYLFIDNDFFHMRSVLRKGGRVLFRFEKCDRPKESVFQFEKDPYQLLTEVHYRDVTYSNFLGISFRTESSRLMSFYFPNYEISPIKIEHCTKIQIKMDKERLKKKVKNLDVK